MRLRWAMPWIAIALLALARQAHAAGGEVERKLIYFGPAISASEVKSKLKMIEMLPFNGITLTFDSAVGPLGSTLFSEFDHTTDEGTMARSVQELAEVQWKRLTDNFVVAEIRDGDPQWEDDARWERVTVNWGVLARAACLVHARGIFLNVESDTGPAFFAHSGDLTAEIRDRVGARGRDIMETVEEICPGLVVLSNWSYSAALPNLPGRWNPEGLVNRDEWSARYRLLPAFLDGILSVIRSRAPGRGLVDGYEFSSSFRSAVDFRFAFGDMKAEARSLSSLRDDYKDRVAAGYSINLDFIPSGELETIARAALHFSDEYVVIHSGLKNLYSDKADPAVIDALWKTRVGRITGAVERVARDEAGKPVLEGWACALGYANPIEVNVLVDGPPGTGTRVAGAIADIASDELLDDHCGSSGGRHRFRIPLDVGTLLDDHRGAPIHVMAVSPVDSTERPIENSGVLRLPAR